jgi:hypothetical protein
MIQAIGIEQDTWRIRTNQELRELYNELDRVTGNKKDKIGMDWIGRQVRNDYGKGS